MFIIKCLVYTVLDEPNVWWYPRGGSRNLRKGGQFFRTAASLETRASPKKADKQGGGGTPTLFFRSAIYVGGGGGGGK